MTSKWESYSRFGINVASTLSSVGFSAAKATTRLGFGIVRGVTSTAVGIACYPLGVGSIMGGAVYTVFSIAEQIALAPILIGESITSTSLVAAESSIDVLSAIFPGSDEASFSLASFVALVKREWNQPALDDHLPRDRYSVAEVAKALVAWGALQGVTYEWKENSWFTVLKEIGVNEPEDRPELRERKESRIRITSDMQPRNIGQIITAEIGDVEPSSDLNISPTTRKRSEKQSHLKSELRRLSKMVLFSYGGAGLLFFGVLFTPPSRDIPSVPNPLRDGANTVEEHTLADAIDASELEASSSSRHPAPSPSPSPNYSWWNVLLGRHDRELFEKNAFIPATMGRHHGKDKPMTAVIGMEKSMPRYWVLTDHGRRQVVLVFRGTMSLNELAVDLTCDPAPFTPASDDDPLGEDEEVPQSTDNELPDSLSGTFHFPSMEPPVKPKLRRRVSVRTVSDNGTDGDFYEVHGGMLRMAQVMGARGRPVHRAVQQALYKNKGYELILTGHSLGAGVASLLALTWANPETCLTVLSSGLPVGRRVSAYIFAPPCLVSPALSKRSRRLITSFTYSHDIVSRLSLGSVRDMNRVAAWLCEANKSDASGALKDEGYSAVTKRALKWRTGYGNPDDPNWFLSMRKTLEANMVMADLFPPGRVLWAIRDGDLHPSHRLPESEGPGSREDKVRLFDVLDVEKVFNQIIFARDMLSSHLPHQYDRVLHELL